MRKTIKIWWFILLYMLLDKSMRMLILYYHELLWKTEENQGKQYLMVNDYTLDKVLDNIKEIIGIEKFDDTKILTDSDKKV